MKKTDVPNSHVSEEEHATRTARNSAITGLVPAAMVEKCVKGTLEVTRRTGQGRREARHGRRRPR